MNDTIISRRRTLTAASGAITGSLLVGTAGADEHDCAQITFTDQTTNCKRVVVDDVYLPDGGFIDIHRRPAGAEPSRPPEEDWQCGPSGCFPLGYPLGATGWLKPGWHEDVTVTLFSDVRCIEWEEKGCLEEDTRMCAMPHRDTTDSRSFVHFCETGADPPYKCDDEVVEDCATISVRERGNR